MSDKTIHLKFKDKKIKAIDNLMERLGETKNGLKRTEFLHQLIDIGMFIKEKSLIDDDENEPDYQRLYVESCRTVLETKHLIEQIFKSTYHNKLSMFSNYHDEILDNTDQTKYVVEQLLSGNDNPNTLKATDEKNI